MYSGSDEFLDRTRLKELRIRLGFWTERGSVLPNISADERILAGVDENFALKVAQELQQKSTDR